jgi:DNA-binding response OmpR family regulator
MSRMRATVVVVTPDANLRTIAEQVIGAAGYRVITAPHTGHALLACMKVGQVDVLAAEWAMDDLSGPALAERLRRICPDMTAVFFGAPDTREHAGVLIRPFTGEELLAAVATARAAADAWQPTTSAS